MSEIVSKQSGRSYPMDKIAMMIATCLRLTNWPLHFLIGRNLMNSIIKIFQLIHTILIIERVNIYVSLAISNSMLCDILS